MKYESKKSKSTSVAVSNDFGFSSVLSGNFQDAREHRLSAAPVFPALCPCRLPPVAAGERNWLIPPCCPPSAGEELVGDGDGCCCPPCPPHVEVLLHPASIHPCGRELGSSSQGRQSPPLSWPERRIVPGRHNDCSRVILINLGEWSSCPGSELELVSVDVPARGQARRSGWAVWQSPIWHTALRGHPDLGKGHGLRGGGTRTRLLGSLVHLTVLLGCLNFCS